MKHPSITVPGPEPGYPLSKGARILAFRLGLGRLAPFRRPRLGDYLGWVGFQGVNQQFSKTANSLKLFSFFAY